MTQNQISYQNLKEQKRHNFAMEDIGKQQAQAALRSAKAQAYHSAGSFANSFVNAFTKAANFFGGLM